MSCRSLVVFIQIKTKSFKETHLSNTYARFCIILIDWLVDWLVGWLVLLRINPFSGH